MSKSLSQHSNIGITTISTEDFYNRLYWDHRIYDLRSKDDYISSHIWRAHNLCPSPVISIDTVAAIDAQIDNDFGRAEQPTEVLIYTIDKIQYDDSQPHVMILDTLLSYLNSSRNPWNKLLKQILILSDGYEKFRSTFPYLCSDNIYYIECSQLSWPSYIKPNLYLGSSICRNKTVISMLKITHIISFSDFSPRQIDLENIKIQHWKISDSLTENLLAVFSPAVAWISQAIEIDKGIVLVHCDQGVSRSASIIIAYLMSSDSNFSTLNATLNYVKSKRSVIQPNISFLQQLEQYSSVLGKETRP